MSLPKAYNDANEYFEDFLRFAKQYQYLFKYPNTNILIENCLESIEVETLKDVDIFDAEFNLSYCAPVNEYVDEFLVAAKKMQFEYAKMTISNHRLSIEAPLSPKKRMEIINLANVIERACEHSHCSTVIDFGSGLGYLDQHIYDKCNYNVLGLECNDDFYVTAKSRQIKYHENSIGKVKYVKHTVSKNSDAVIQEYLKEKFSETNRICVTGLHACADLSIDVLNVFLKMPNAQCIILMSCCYHKMEPLGTENGTFKNFPLSKSLKHVYQKYRAFEFLNVPFLRLATQPPNPKENLANLVFNLLARAVIQLYAYKYNYKVSRKKRKAVHTKYLDNDFECYMQQAVSGFDLSCSDNKCGLPSTDNTTDKPQMNCQCKISFNLPELHEIWKQTSFNSLFLKAGIYVLLQRYLQPIFENLLLFDRVVYLKECGLRDVVIEKIINDSISPRCFALLASKNELYL